MMIAVLAALVLTLTCSVALAASDVCPEAEDGIHYWDITDEWDATCTKDGGFEETCKYCGAKQTTITVPAHHTWDITDEWDAAASGKPAWSAARRRIRRLRTRSRIR